MTRHEDAREHPAARLLGGGSAGLVTGLTFVPIDVLESFAQASRPGPAGPVGPAAWLAAAAEALGVDFAFVPGDATWAAVAASGLAAREIAPFWAVPGPFSRAIAQLGWSEAVRRTVGDVDSLTGALDEWAADAPALVREGVAGGAAAIVVTEDLAGAHGPIVAPDFVFDEIMPRLAVIIREASLHGLPVALHSDGDVRVFLPGAARAGFSGVHGGGPDETGFMTLLREARRFGLRVIGGIGSASLGTRESAAQAGRSAASLALAGDVLIADDGGIASLGELEGVADALAAACGAQ